MSLKKKKSLYICPDLTKGAPLDPGLKADAVKPVAFEILKGLGVGGSPYSSADSDSSVPDLDSLGSTGSDGAILSGYGVG